MSPSYKRKLSNYFIRPGYQMLFLSWLLVSGGCLIVLSNWFLYTALETIRVESDKMGAVAGALQLNVLPALGAQFAKFNVVTISLMVLSTLTGIVLSHMSAGPIYRFKKTFEEIRDGNRDLRVHLRRYDHFQDVASAFNEMMDRLTGTSGSSPSLGALAKPRGENGFTLVEIMVVVTIIGILAALGMPSYRRYIRQGRQAEAKTKIASAYTVEHAYSVETSSYIACIGNVGFTSAKGGSNYYTIGFNDAATQSGACGPDGKSSCLIYNRDINKGDATKGLCTHSDGYTFFKANVADNADAPDDAKLTASSLTKTKFVIQATGAIGLTDMDSWTVDQDKNVVQISDGVNNK